MIFFCKSEIQKEVDDVNMEEIIFKWIDQRKGALTADAIVKNFDIDRKFGRRIYDRYVGKERSRLTLKNKKSGLALKKRMYEDAEQKLNVKKCKEEEIRKMEERKRKEEEEKGKLEERKLKQEEEKRKLEEQKKRKEEKKSLVTFFTQEH